jgi:hypothetical protein
MDTVLSLGSVQIFFMIDEGDISFIQCTMSLTERKSVRKVDVLGLIIIDFYVPALTSRLNSTETSLQLSENITLFVVCHICTGIASKDT